jgi:hypothetical protein
VANEEIPTEINVCSEAWQAMQVFDNLMKSVGTKDLQSQWSILKNYVELRDGTGFGSPRPRKVIKLQLEVSDEIEPSSNSLFLINGTLPGSSHQ